MAITGAHVVLHSPEPDALRSLLANILGSEGVDAGGGWPIYPLPPAEIAVHPSDGAKHEFTFMCDDLTATMAELAAKGVEYADEPKDEGWGVVVTMALPGGLKALLYEPRHPTAL